MATKRKNLYLYLALGCFVAIIAIFVHGYMGIYDTAYVTAGGWERRFDWHWWQRDWTPHVDARWGEAVPFRYEIENRRFSSYLTSVRVSVWKGHQKVIDLFSEDKSIEPFGKVMMEWTLDSEQLQAQGFGAGIYTVKIERKGVEREIRVSFHIVESYGDVVLPLPPPPFR
jgi:hypothetical protein